MTAQALAGRAARPRWMLVGAGGLAAAAAGLWLASGGAGVEAWFLVFILLAGLVTGSLGLLTIGRLMSEEWLMPIRSEAEAAALTAPLLLVLAFPLAFALDELYPWASAVLPALPRPRAAYLSPGFFLARSAFYLAIWIALAFWITHTRAPRRAGAIGLALLAPTATFAANDWVLSREPLWWSSSFGFAFAVSQLLAALAAGVLISLLRPEHPTAVRMQSLERALLTLALLVLWVWFAPFLIVWLGNLPEEAAWYLARSGVRLLLLVGIALPALLAAVVVLVPPGFSRRTMIVGSALLLIHHLAYMLWLLRPATLGPLVAGPDLVAVAGLGAAWAACFAVILRRRPRDEIDRGGPAAPAPPAP